MPLKGPIEIWLPESKFIASPVFMINKQVQNYSKPVSYSLSSSLLLQYFSIFCLSFSLSLSVTHIHSQALLRYAAVNLAGIFNDDVKV